VPVLGRGGSSPPSDTGRPPGASPGPRALGSGGTARHPLFRGRSGRLMGCWMGCWIGFCSPPVTLVPDVIRATSWSLSWKRPPVTLGGGTFAGGCETGGS